LPLGGVVLQLWGDTEEIVAKVEADMQQLIDANSSIAQCHLEVLVAEEQQQQL